MSSAIIMPNIVLEGLWPIVLLSIAAALSLLVSAFGGRKADLPATLLAMIGLVAASIAALAIGETKLNSFQSTHLSGPFNDWLIVLFCAAGFLTLLLGLRDRLDKRSWLEYTTQDLTGPRQTCQVGGLPFPRRRV